MNFSFTIYLLMYHLNFPHFFCGCLQQSLDQVKRSLNVSADGTSPKAMGQSHKIILALNQKVKLPDILQAGFGGLFQHATPLSTHMQ